MESVCCLPGCIWLISKCKVLLKYLGNIKKIKSIYITLPTKICIVKAMCFFLFVCLFVFFPTSHVWI